MIEPGLLTLSIVRRGFARGQRDRFYFRLKPLGFGHEIEPVAIRQTKVAQQNIHAHVLEKLQRIGHATGRDHLMIRASQKVRENSTGILMIFNDEDIHAMGEIWGLFSETD